MEISITHLLDGARQAEGLTVIIDVFRAFSLECYLYDQNASLIIPVSEIDIAFKLKKENPASLLIGERNEKKIEGFEYGNSPAHIKNIDFTGKTIIHTTSAGTQGIVNAANASEIITGSFVNADAIIRYINLSKPEKVSLVCMGYSMLEQSEEDTLCAEYISAKLRNQKTDFVAMVEKIKNTSGKRFFDPAKSAYSPSEDFDLCLALNRFDFIIRSEKQSNGLIFNRKINF